MKIGADRLRCEGFTLVELVIVITIVGILGAAAIVRFVDLRSDAADATAKAASAAIGAGTAMNHAKVTAKGAGTVIQNGTTCASLPDAFLDGGLAANMSMAGASIAGCAGAGSVATSCAVQHSHGTAGGFAVRAYCTN